jgi:deoxycytidine triphosphate deaminase
MMGMGKTKFIGIIYQDGTLIDRCVIDVRDIDNYKFYNALKPKIVKQKEFRSQERAFDWTVTEFQQYCII